MTYRIQADTVSGRLLARVDIDLSPEQRDELMEVFCLGSWGQGVRVSFFDPALKAHEPEDEPTPTG